MDRIPQGRPAEEPPLLDRTVLDPLRGTPGEGGGSALGEILDLYRDLAPSLLRGLRDALASGSLRDAERVAHTLRGSTINLGGAALGAFALRLEEAARRGDAAVAKALLPEVEDLLRRTVEALEKARTGA